MNNFTDESVNGLLSALAVAIRESLSHSENQRFLFYLDARIEYLLFSHESPLTDADRQGLQTMKQILQMHLDSPHMRLH